MMYKSLFLILALALSGCSTVHSSANKSSVRHDNNKITIYENGQKGMASLITGSALRSFNEDYIKAPKNRAFAQSTSGAWNWKSDRTSIEHAITSALIGCQRNNKKSEDLYPCKVIHINDEWVE
jgi:hypothetical protein